MSSIDERYLLRKINDISEPLVAEAEAVQQAMIEVASKMIAELHWADFEVLSDLILTRGGWQRVSVLGETMADIDLIIEQPTLGERATVQVKSRANRAGVPRNHKGFTGLNAQIGITAAKSSSHREALAAEHMCGALKKSSLAGTR